jgi:peptidoglycan-associated lipoprotein
MAVQFKMACYAILAGFLLTLSGCAQSATPKTDLSSSGSGPQAKADPRQGEGTRTAPTEAGTSPGSLDALQKGESTAAPGPLKDIQFDYDRYDLRADARDMLKTNADWLKKNPAARVEIEGHCDERGTNEYNLALGAKRAQAAKDYLVTLGISGERLSTISYGEEIPLCREQTESCWSRNRRARFVVVPARPAS